MAENNEYENQEYESYYVPAQSKWPFFSSIGLGFLAFGAAMLFQGRAYGVLVFGIGLILTASIIYLWFKDVIKESLSGLYSNQMDLSFRLGMFWFIFSEVFFFICFFGALFYVRNFSVPWLGGADNNYYTNSLLWSHFSAHWPLLNNPSSAIVGPQKAMGPLWLPTINTFILIISSITVTLAHHAILKLKQNSASLWMAISVMLGALFIALQGLEYVHAYNDGLTLSSGIYGTTFFMLTGFHGLHVSIGTIMLAIMFGRNRLGHFSKDKHFAFEAAAWYWHFVDIIWLILFVYVYILPIN